MAPSIHTHLSTHFLTSTQHSNNSLILPNEMQLSFSLFPQNKNTQTTSSHTMYFQVLLITLQIQSQIYWTILLLKHKIIILRITSRSCINIKGRVREKKLVNMCTQARKSIHICYSFATFFFNYLMYFSFAILQELGWLGYFIW